MANPFFMDALNSSGLTFSNSWNFQPIQRFGQYEFTNPKQAAEFMGTRNFTDFWGKGNVSPSNVAARVEYQTLGRYAIPMVSPTQLTTDLKAANTRYINAVNNPLTLSLNGEENLKTRLNFKTTGIRAEGRFYTPVEEGVLKNYLGYGVSKGEDLPIRVIADERVSRSRLSGERFGGWTSTTGTETHDAGMGTEGRRRNLSRVGGRDLGLALSSNPTEEVFVPSNMARPASQGGSSRVAGRITDAGKIVLGGMPKTSVPMQVLGNINRVGGVLAEKALAPIGLGMQIYGATRAGHYDKNYGYSDPLALRPAWDFMFNLIGGAYEGKPISQSWNEMAKQVADPEWIQRNQFGSIPYNAVLNTDAFIQGLKDTYVPMFKEASKTWAESGGLENLQ